MGPGWLFYNKKSNNWPTLFQTLKCPSVCSFCTAAECVLNQRHTPMHMLHAMQLQLRRLLNVALSPDAARANYPAAIWTSIWLSSAKSDHVLRFFFFIIHTHKLVMYIHLASTTNLFYPFMRCKDHYFELWRTNSRIWSSIYDDQLLQHHKKTCAQNLLKKISDL